MSVLYHLPIHKGAGGEGSWWYQMLEVRKSPASHSYRKELADTRALRHGDLLVLLLLRQSLALLAPSTTPTSTTLLLVKASTSTSLIREYSLHTLNLKAVLAGESPHRVVPALLMAMVMALTVLVRLLLPNLASPRRPISSQSRF